MRALIFLFYFFCSICYAANGGAYRVKSCNTTKVSQPDRIREIAIQQCEETKSSPQCKQVYKMIIEDGGDLNSKQLNCQKQAESSWLGAMKSRVSGCLVDGIFDSTFGSMGRAIGESLAENKIYFENNKERLKKCDQNIEHKNKIFEAYNSTVPKVLQVAAPAEDKMKITTCENLEKLLHYNRKTKENSAHIRIEYNRDPKTSSFNEDEIEYLAWKEKISASQNPVKSSGATDQGLLDKAYEKLGEFGVRLECYNSESAAALSCEALFAVVGGVRTGVMAAASGLKAARLQKQINALKEIGREGRIAKATTEIAPLNEAQKIQKLQSELGRTKTLSKKETDAVQKAHNEGSARGETYGTYKGDTLREKKRILMKEGRFSEQEADFMIMRGYVGNAPVKGDKFFITDGRVLNMPQAVTADANIKAGMDAIKALDDKFASQQSLTDAELGQFIGKNEKLYTDVRAKAQSVYEYEPGKLVSQHESSVIRIFGRDADYGDDVVKLASKKGGNIGLSLNAEMEALKQQANVYFESAKKNGNILDYYRGKSLMDARKRIGYAAEDRGIPTSIDGFAADDEFTAIRDSLMKDNNLKKKITDLEKYERNP